MIVRALNTAKIHPLLKAGKEYVVLGIDDENYRVLTETGDPALISKKDFEIIDDLIPDDWIWKFYDDGEYFADPKGLDETGFYEDLFDKKSYAMDRFINYLRSIGINESIYRGSPRDLGR
jgi:hypothetical protein